MSGTPACSGSRAGSDKEGAQLTHGDDGRPGGGADSRLPGDPALPRLLLDSYERLTGVSLLPADVGRDEAAQWLYEAAPFCVLAHDTAPDPRFVYANKAAQRCFEYTWAEFTALPSRLSAEAPNRAERQRLLDQVSRQGYASGYQGLRVARSGRRFWIEDGTVWQLVGADGAVRGQAAAFPRWRDADPGGMQDEAQA